jgi:hypothetical protein
MSSRPPHPKLRILVDRLHDGPPLSKTEVAQLEELLEDDEALAYYLEVSHQEALLASVIPRHRPALPAGQRLTRFPRFVAMPPHPRPLLLHGSPGWSAWSGPMKASLTRSI